MLSCAGRDPESWHTARPCWCATRWTDLNHPARATRMPVPHGNPTVGRACVYIRHADRVTGVLSTRAQVATRLVPVGAKHWRAPLVYTVAVSPAAGSPSSPFQFGRPSIRVPSAGGRVF